LFCYVVRLPHLFVVVVVRLIPLFPRLFYHRFYRSFVSCLLLLFVSGSTFVTFYLYRSWVYVRCYVTFRVTFVYVYHVFTVLRTCYVFDLRCCSICCCYIPVTLFYHHSYILRSFVVPGVTFIRLFTILPFIVLLLRFVVVTIALRLQSTCTVVVTCVHTTTLISTTIPPFRCSPPFSVPTYLFYGVVVIPRSMHLLFVLFFTFPVLLGTFPLFCSTCSGWFYLISHTLFYGLRYVLRFYVVRFLRVPHWVPLPLFVALFYCHHHHYRCSAFLPALPAPARTPAFYTVLLDSTYVSAFCLPLPLFLEHRSAPFWSLPPAACIWCRCYRSGFTAVLRSVLPFCVTTCLPLRSLRSTFLPFVWIPPLRSTVHRLRCCVRLGPAAPATASAVLPPTCHHLPAVVSLPACLRLRFCCLPRCVSCYVTPFYHVVRYVVVHRNFAFWCSLRWVVRYVAVLRWVISYHGSTFISTTTYLFTCSPLLFVTVYGHRFLGRLPFVVRFVVFVTDHLESTSTCSTLHRSWEFLHVRLFWKSFLRCCSPITATVVPHISLPVFYLFLPITFYVVPVTHVHVPRYICSGEYRCSTTTTWDSVLPPPTCRCPLLMQCSACIPWYSPFLPFYLPTSAFWAGWSCSIRCSFCCCSTWAYHGLVISFTFRYHHGRSCSVLFYRYRYLPAVLYHWVCCTCTTAGLPPCTASSTAVATARCIPPLRCVTPRYVFVTVYRCDLRYCVTFYTVSTLVLHALPFVLPFCGLPFLPAIHHSTFTVVSVVPAAHHLITVSYLPPATSSFCSTSFTLRLFLRSLPVLFYRLSAYHLFYRCSVILFYRCVLPVVHLLLRSDHRLLFPYDDSTCTTSVSFYRFISVLITGVVPFHVCVYLIS